MKRVEKLIKQYQDRLAAIDEQRIYLKSEIIDLKEELYTKEKWLIQSSTEEAEIINFLDDLNSIVETFDDENKKPKK